MNYLFQFSGTFRNGVPGHFAYSDIDVALDENHLVDQIGISQKPQFKSYGGAHLCMGSPVAIFSYNDPVRWDCQDEDPDTTGKVQQLDVNADGAISLLVGSNDWTHILLVPTNSSAVQPGQEPKTDVLQDQLGALAPVMHASVQASKVKLSWTSFPLEAVKGYVITRSSEDAKEAAAITAVPSTSNTFTDQAPSGAYSYTVRTLLENLRGSETATVAGLSPNQLLALQLFKKRLFTPLSATPSEDVTASLNEWSANAASSEVSGVQPLLLRQIAGMSALASLGAPSSAIRVIIP
jgi:hypothetical protein